MRGNLGFLPVWFEDVVALVTVLSLIVALVASYLAYRYAKDQLVSAKENLAAGYSVARGQFILAIDDSLARYEDLRTDVTYGPREFTRSGRDSAELRYYVAVFERLGLLTSEGLLEPREVDDLYGSRFAKLLHNTPAASIVARTEDWWGFIWLWNTLADLGRRLPEPPALPARPKGRMGGPEGDEPASSTSASP
jgi:hypothetical protein